MIAKGIFAICMLMSIISGSISASDDINSRKLVHKEPSSRRLSRKLRGKSHQEKGLISTAATSQTSLNPGEDENKYLARIINGFESFKPHKYYVLLLNNNTPIGCGGVLIHKSFVLTAAHCLVDYEVNRVLVNAFAPWTKDNGGTPGHLKRVSNTYIHDEFNEKMFRKDFALLKLDSDVDEEFIPVELPTSSREYEIGETFTVMGFGKVSDEQEYSKTLRETNVKYVPEDSCPLIQVKGEDSMLCALGDGTDSCQGDSGGPLISTSSDENELVGIVSWYVLCIDVDHRLHFAD